jgi:hypothetical protein
MQMEDQRAEDGEDALAVGVGDADPEDRLPDLGVDDAFLELRKVAISPLRFAVGLAVASHGHRQRAYTL